MLMSRPYISHVAAHSERGRSPFRWTLASTLAAGFWPQSVRPPVAAAAIFGRWTLRLCAASSPCTLRPPCRSRDTPRCSDLLV